MPDRRKRNVAGPADPATIHRELEKRLAEREPMPPTEPPDIGAEDAPEPTIIGAARALRRRKRQIEEATGE